MSEMRLVDEDDAARTVDERVESREWWIFVGASDLLCAVEDRFYADDASGDFEILIGPPAGEFAKLFPDRRFLPLTFARKSRMTPEQLSALVAERGGKASPEVLEHQDIVFAFEVP